MPIDSGRYFWASDEIDGQSDGKNFNGSMRPFINQQLIWFVNDRVGVGGLAG
jgi:hypothetical protein